MPILNIEIIGNIDDNTLAQTLAQAAGKILESKPGGTWVKLCFIDRHHYAENGDLPPEVLPVFVSVLLGRHYESNEYANLAFEIAKSFAPILHRSAENIHIIFEPSVMGRIAFGGKLLTEN